jgi:serine/threonine-protein kinase
VGRPQAVIAAHAKEEPRPLSIVRPAIPHGLASLVMRCIAKRPADRPQHAEDLIHELDALAPSVNENATPPASRTRRVPWAVIGASALVITAVAAAFTAWRYRLATRAATPPVASRPSIAVMPMVAIGGDPADEAFTDALVEELISALSKVEALDVKASTSVFALKGKGLSIRALGDTLGVANLLQTRMARSGDRIKVTTDLVRVADDKVVWSNPFSTRDSKDYFAVQEEIAQAVVRALSVRLADPSDRLVEYGTADVQARDLFAQGKFHRDLLTPDGLRESIGFFKQAIARDTNFAAAYAWLGSVHTLLAVFGVGPGTKELPEARRWVDAALRKDSLLAEAHWMKAELLFNHDHDVAAAKSELRRAMELDPRNSHARFFLGMEAMRAFPDSALIELHRGLANDPLSSELLMAAGVVFQSTHSLDSATRYLRRAVLYTPSFTFARQNLAHALLEQGNHAEAIAQFEDAARIGGARDSAQLAYGYAVSSRRPDAERILRALEASKKTRYLPPATVAMAYAGLGNKTKAVSWLVRAEKDNDPMLAMLTSSAFDSLRADPRYAPLMKHLEAIRDPTVK